MLFRSVVDGGLFDVSEAGGVEISDSGVTTHSIGDGNVSIVRTCDVLRVKAAVLAALGG